MTDYKQTLNLPYTEFAMKANLAQREPETLARWQAINIYGQLRQQRAGNPQFILHDGPPYANGQIHIGHALGKILKDMVIKAKTLSGYDAPYVPGWDCHGLPIELNVEKKIGKAGVKVSHREFRKACREYAQQQVNDQRESFKRLGVLGDWDNPYLTMDFAFEANIIRSLAKITANGHLQQGSKPVHWCIECGSALAEAEVEYETKRSPAIDVSFPLMNVADLVERCSSLKQVALPSKVAIPIWTTTPWTLPANQAVALSPEHHYCVVVYKRGTQSEALLIAEPLVADVMQRYQILDYQVIANCSGQALEGLSLQHPFYTRSVPVILGEHVTMDSGTGAVHTAPGHGQEDYLVGLRYDLPVVNPVAGNGCFLADIPLFGGEHIYKANEHIIAELERQGNLLHATTLEHSYPHCWRHKTPLIFRATPQWFINMDKQQLRQQALAAIEGVNWLPDWGMARITGMVGNRPDWCISRQRTWSVPIAVFTHKQTGDLHPNTSQLMEQVASMVAEQGIEAWFELEPSQLLGDEASDYDKCQDTLDVWFDSGVTHAAVLAERPELRFPADLYLEGSDQHRGWFQSSLLTAVAMTGQAPYGTVLTHGFTVDAKGHKMSKSLGNVISSDKAVSSLGADVLRLWVASSDYRGEIAFSDEIWKRVGDTYRRLRNTARFLLANINGFDPEQHLVPMEAMLALDQWLVDRTRLLQAEIQQAFDDYQFHVIYQKIHHFCAVELGGFYLDIIKDRQYTTLAEGLPRRSAQTAMFHVAEALVRWLTPITSFTAEEIWQLLPGKRETSVLLTTWYDQLAALPADSNFTQNDWQQIIQLREAVNKELEQCRNEGLLGSGLEAEITIYATAKWYELLERLQDELRFVLITSEAKLVAATTCPEHAKSSILPGVWLQIAASSHAKCVRCWHRRADIGSEPQHPELCGRCVENVMGHGESRRYA